MKKNVSIVMAVLILLAVLTGCGTKVNEEVGKTAEGLLTAMQEGDLAGQYAYATDEAINDSESYYIYYRPVDEFINAVDAQFQIRDAEISMEDYELPMSELKRVVDKNLVKSYEVESVTQKGDVGTVTAKINFGLNMDKAKEINLTKEIDALADSYQKAHQSELETIRSEQGETGMLNQIALGIGSDVAAKYTQALLSTGEVIKEVVMTVEETSDGWKVTSYTEQ